MCVSLSTLTTSAERVAEQDGDRTVTSAASVTAIGRTSASTASKKRTSPMKNERRIPLILWLLAFVGVGTVMWVALISCMMG